LNLVVISFHTITRHAHLSRRFWSL